MHFISLFCLISLARTSTTILYRRGESGHSYLGPNLKGNTYNFSPLSIMLVYSGYVPYVLYYIKICSFYTQSVKGFYHERMSNDFSSSIETIM